MNADRDARGRVEQDHALDVAATDLASWPPPLVEVPPTAPHRWTAATLTAGVIGSAVCFLIAGAAELLGADTGSGEMTDVGALVVGLAELTPWAWASLGTLAVVLSPALGLLATAYEFATVSDRRTVLLALTVLTILVMSASIAFMR